VTPAAIGTRLCVTLSDPVFVSPDPSCRSQLLPHAHTVPSGLSATEKPMPVAIEPWL